MYFKRILSFIGSSCLIVLLLFCSNIQSQTVSYITARHYPVEEHKILTDDGYILTLFRIPYSPHINDQLNSRRKPSVLLHHGFALSSDTWVLNEPDTGLAYQLADAGFDVWLGNQRGNRYSRSHAALSPESPSFWDFSLHEMGFYDLAAMFDYILKETKSSGLHFVGYSQATMALLVLLSSRPEYNGRLRTAHLLAPIVYLKGFRHPWSRYFGLLLNILTLESRSSRGFRETMWIAHHPVFRQICENLCAPGSRWQFLCRKIYEYIGGPGTNQFDELIIDRLCELHPDGTSTKLLIHLLQIFDSNQFHDFDYGTDQNRIHYGQDTPPAYNLSVIDSCIDLYYSTNDYIAGWEDVELLTSQLPCTRVHRISHVDWNHCDFIWSKNVKEELNDRIIERMKSREEQKEYLSDVLLY